jgi:putative toxin-antitoxin system antitoxin component (TIGR02293 family)
MLSNIKVFVPSNTARTALMPGARLLNLKSRTPQEVESEIDHGIPTSKIDILRNASGITEAQMARVLGISIATLQRRKSRRRILKPDESIRAFRLARIIERANDVLGDAEEAREWLHEPLLAIGNRTPLDAAQTELGSELVLQVLGRLEDGVYS